MREVPEIALEARDARRLRLLPLQLLDPVAEVGREPVEAPAPARLALVARAAADHRRLDDQLFPLPRRSQRAGHDRLIVRVDRLVGRPDDLLVRLDLVVGRSARFAAVFAGKHFVERPDRRQAPGAASVTRGTWPSDRYSSKRFADSPSTAHDSSATNARPGRIRPARAAIEVHRHAAARAGVLEQAEVLLRRAQKHGHLVERHAALRFVEHAPDDLHRLASFARRGEQHDVAGALTLGRALDLEHVPAQTIQI